MSSQVVQVNHQLKSKTISDVRALACEAGGHRFDSWDQSDTEGLTITEEEVLQPLPYKNARPWDGSNDHIEMVVLSPSVRKKT